jgi:hypothetical protein
MKILSLAPDGSHCVLQNLLCYFWAGLLINGQRFMEKSGVGRIFNWNDEFL